MAQLPPPVAALPLPAAAPLMEAATTYRQILSDQTCDAVHGQPAGAYLAGYRFDFEGGAQPAPARSSYVTRS